MIHSTTIKSQNVILGKQNVLKTGRRGPFHHTKQNYILLNLLTSMDCKGGNFAKDCIALRNAYKNDPQYSQGCVKGERPFPYATSLGLRNTLLSGSFYIRLPLSPLQNTLSGLGERKTSEGLAAIRSPSPVTTSSCGKHGSRGGGLLK